MENAGSPVTKTSQESVLSSRASCSETSSNHHRNRYPCCPKYPPGVWMRVTALHDCGNLDRHTHEPDSGQEPGIALGWTGSSATPTPQEKRNCMPCSDTLFLQIQLN